MATDSFNTIGLIGRQQLPQVTETVNEVHQFLTNRQLEVIIGTGTEACLDQTPSTIKPATELGKYCDLIIVVGGDGSLLHAARCAVADNTPILGINRGHLGFLADVAPNEFEVMLSEILSGKYIVEERLLLETEVFSEGHIIYSEIAINDIVLKQGDIPNMLAFDIHIDKHCIAEERADGIIIATPTGSTAYALSGGGPILHPGLQAYLLLSMFSHTLSNRPVVVPKESITEISLNNDNQGCASFRCDGLDMIHLNPGTGITIKPSAKKLQLIHPNRYNYFDNLRDKLSWGQQAHHKA